MYQLLESIYLKDGAFRNIAYHEARMKASVSALLGEHLSIDLHYFFSQQIIPSKGLFKTRLIYTNSILKMEFVPYVVKPVNAIRLIEDNQIDYAHKFVDRADLAALYSKRETADDVLIVKNGLITDTSYGNIIFKKDGRWYTPESYLLKGTMRQSLLDSGVIKETQIDSTNYKQFESCKIINAMLGMDSAEIPVSSIQ